MNNMLPCARAADVRACVPDRGLLAPRVRFVRVNRMIVLETRGRTWLGKVGDDADGVGNALQARVRGAKALALRRGRLVHRHGGVVAAADLVVLLLPHIHEVKPIDAPASLG